MSGRYLGGICLVTDRNACALSCAEMAGIALKAGVRWVQYRRKDSDRRVLYGEALLLRRLTHAYGAVLIINDHADIAAAVSADGVHLGQEDLPIAEARRMLGGRILIGLSTHSVEEAARAERDGADYIGFGPVFHTTTKDAGNPRGTRLLNEVKRKVRIPVVAIGGIAPGNIDAVMGAGADAVAVASGVLMGDIPRNIKRFRNAMATA